jgi:hypothetical protein
MIESMNMIVSAVSAAAGFVRSVGTLADLARKIKEKWRPPVTVAAVIYDVYRRRILFGIVVENAEDAAAVRVERAGLAAEDAERPGVELASVAAEKLLRGGARAEFQTAWAAPEGVEDSGLVIRPFAEVGGGKLVFGERVDPENVRAALKPRDPPKPFAEIAERLANISLRPFPG